MRIVSLLSLLGVFFSNCSAPENSAQPPANNSANQPNIILILADDMGYGDPGFNGGEIIHTPVLNQLAEGGMVFTQHYSGNTVCAPSRSVLMTGLHTGHTPLPDSTKTMAEVLKDVGYATGAFGKWGLGYPGSEGMPSIQGFDEFFGYLCQRRAHFYYPEFLFHDIRGQDLQKVILEGNKVDDSAGENFLHPGSGPPIEKGTYSQDAITEQALNFIDQHSEDPFFLYFPSPLPHSSMTVPEEAMAPYLDDEGNSIFKEEPFTSDHFTDQAMPKATYAAMVTYLDKQIGMILDKLKEKGIEEETLIIFSSDNGSHTSGGYHFSMLDSNAPLRGGKRDLYEGGIRVPTLAYWPGVIQPNTKSELISGFQDLFPTFSELANAPIEIEIDGISLAPTLTDKGDQQEHDYLYWEFIERGGKQAVRKGRWKAVKLNVSTEDPSPIELYNLEQDILEANDVSGQYPEIVKELQEIMNEAHTSSKFFSLYEEEKILN
jgi:arylsulfatase A-like enzyme